ncbi:MAG: AGE family epimerase/isomerase [Pseudomonadota bacterium]
MANVILNGALSVAMDRTNLSARLPILQQEFKQELIAIADWWVANSVDQELGGFYGEISAENIPVKDANKGVILNSRILWFFSEVALEINNPAYRQCAKRAYDYLLQYFFDKKQGGVYWELDCFGNPINAKKQTYAQAFTIYALSAYYKLTHSEHALALALNCFELLETKTIDRACEGYLEAFTRTWGKMEDLRLSDKDLNFPKSQNTHLHVLEAYTSLYNIHPTPEIKTALRYNIELFDQYLIDKKTFHLRMFLDNHWNDFSPGVTYGHDIEASWLIAKALDALDDAAYTAALTPTLIKIAAVTLQEGIDSYGQVMDSCDFASGKVNANIVWWVQAEALVGFLYAYVTSNEQKYLTVAENLWQAIKKYQIDQQHGEWHWSSVLDSSPVLESSSIPDNSALDRSQAEPIYKVGFWKCPYHNGRAMIEAGRYLTKIQLD